MATTQNQKCVIVAVCIAFFVDYSVIATANTHVVYKSERTASLRQRRDLDVGNLTDTAPNLENRKAERTLILLKPDTVQRGLIGKIIERFEAKGLKLVGLKFLWATNDLMEKHYTELSDRPFYEELIKFMISGPVVPMVWEGLNAITLTRKMLGKAEPELSSPGTIRSDFSSDVKCSIIHGSHTNEAAKREIDLWFQKSELVSWTQANSNFVVLS